MKKLLTVVLFLIGVTAFGIGKKDLDEYSFVIFPGHEWNYGESYVAVKGKSICVFGRGDCIRIDYDDIKDLGRNVSKALKVLQFWEDMQGEFVTVYPDWFLAEKYELTFDENRMAILKNVEIDYNYNW